MLKKARLSWTLVSSLMLVHSLGFGAIIIITELFNHPRIGYGQIPSNHHWLGIIIVSASILVPILIWRRTKRFWSGFGWALALPMSLALVGIDYAIVGYHTKIPHPFDILAFFIVATLLVLARFPSGRRYDICTRLATLPK
jgi:hypothetical protein